MTGITATWTKQISSDLWKARGMWQHRLRFWLFWGGLIWMVTLKFASKNLRTGWGPRWPCSHRRGALKKVTQDNLATKLLHQGTRLRLQGQAQLIEKLTSEDVRLSCVRVEANNGLVHQVTTTWVKEVPDWSQLPNRLASLTKLENLPHLDPQAKTSSSYLTTLISVRRTQNTTVVLWEPAPDELSSQKFNTGLSTRNHANLLRIKPRNSNYQACSSKIWENAWKKSFSS